MRLYHRYLARLQIFIWNEIDNKDTTEPRFPSFQVDVITSKVYGQHHDFDSRYGICSISCNQSPVPSSFTTYHHGQHHDFDSRYGICSIGCNQSPVPSSFTTYHQIIDSSSTTDANRLCGVETAYSSGTSEFTSPSHFQLFWFCNFSILSVADKGYSRNGSLVLNLISTFLL
jgi:hypothetical protein